MLSSYRWPRGIKFHIYLVKNKTNKKNQERKLQKKKKNQERIDQLGQNYMFWCFFN